MLNPWEQLRSWKPRSIASSRLATSLCMVLVSALSLAAQTVTFAASNIREGDQLLPAGTICATPSGPVATGFQIGSTGQTGAPVCRDVLAGVIQATLNGNTLGTMTLADTGLSSPVNPCYNVTVRDPSGAYILGTAGTQPSGYSCVQPTANNSWCTSGACNFDKYVPDIPGGSLGTTVTDLTVGNLDVTGTCTGCDGGAGVWGSITGTISAQTDLWSYLTTIPAASSATPNMDSGSGSAGSATTYARGDHTHPTDTSRAGNGVCPSNQYESSDTASGPGCSQVAYSQLSGAPSIPSPSSATPNMDSGAGSAGSSASYSRGDHTHPTDTSRAGNGACPSNQFESSDTASGPGCAQVAYSQVSGTPAALPPNGAAGGDLNGSYPNPSVAKVNGNAPGGSCTNQLVSSLDSSGRPSCSTVNSSEVDSSICSNAGCSQSTTGTAANLSGTPSLPNGVTTTTQAAGDSTAKLATDAFVGTAIAKVLQRVDVTLTPSQLNGGSEWEIIPQPPTGYTINVSPQGYAYLDFKTTSYTAAGTLGCAMGSLTLQISYEGTGGDTVGLAFSPSGFLDGSVSVGQQLELDPNNPPPIMATDFATGISLYLKNSSSFGSCLLASGDSPVTITLFYSVVATP